MDVLEIGAYGMFFMVLFVIFKAMMDALAEKGWTFRGRRIEAHDVVTLSLFALAMTLYAIYLWTEEGDPFPRVLAILAASMAAAAVQVFHTLWKTQPPSKIETPR